MNRRRRLSAVAVFALASALAAPSTASASWLDPVFGGLARPDESGIHRGQRRALTSASSSFRGTGALEFGGSYAIDSSVAAVNHDLACATTDPVRMCQRYSGPMQRECERQAMRIRSMNCAQRGGSLSASSGASAMITVFGKDLPIYSVRASSSSSSTAAPSGSWNLALMGYNVAGGAGAAQSGRYIVPDYGIDLFGRDIVAVQGFVFRVGVSTSGQLWVDRRIEAGPNATVARADVSPGGSLWGNVIAGPGAGQYTVGVQGRLELLSLSVPLEASVQRASGNAATYHLSRGLTIGMSAGNVSFGVFGPGMPNGLQIPIVGWNGARFTVPVERAAGNVTF